MIFTRGDLPSVLAVKNTLDKFASWSGLHANITKTDIFFGGVSKPVKDLILEQTGFVKGQFPFRYLGIPLHSSRVAADVYGMLLSKVQCSVQHWSSNLLSYAGKIQLINSVIFGLETFWCSSVLLHKAIVKEINKLCKNFFWGTTDGQARMVHKSWKGICASWEEGGFGIKELISWNKALLLKLIWQHEQGTGGIWVQWTVRYNLAYHDFWDVRAKTFHAESFRGLIQVRYELIEIMGSHHGAKTALCTCVTGGRFSVARAYDLFRGKMPKLGWSKALNCSFLIPSHKVTTSLAAQRK
ncbi:hypothetical protein RND81_03G144800 [Saponaria officinalis]|uniref:Uncharacterized protein n=1 Tax=Saponaria officinalis TaxID=3572 RepID=A0AAW1M8V6_SAPOF